MAWRAIQSTVGVSTTLASLTDVQERVWWRLVGHSDPWGRLDARPAKVRALCWPMLTHITDEAAGEALLTLQRLERIVVYERGGAQVIQILDFEEHQPREAFRKRPPKSSFPDPPAAVKPTPGLVEGLYGLAVPESFRNTSGTSPGTDENNTYAGVSGTYPEPLRNDSGDLPDEKRGDERRRDQKENNPSFPPSEARDAAREPDGRTDTHTGDEEPNPLAHLDLANVLKDIPA